MPEAPLGQLRSPAPDGSRRPPRRLAATGEPRALEALAALARAVSERWTVLGIPADRIGPEGVDVLLMPIDGLSDDSVRGLGARLDVPVVLYTSTCRTTARPAGETPEDEDPNAVLSLAETTPRAFARQVESTIARWRFASSPRTEWSPDNASAESRAEFLSAVNHEVRTPLNAIMGMTATLLETELDDTQHRYARTVHDAGASLVRVLDALVDLARVRAGGVQLSLIEFDLEVAVRRAAEQEAQSVGERGLGISVAIEPGIPGTVIGAADRFEEVVRLLIDCSLRLTTRGEIRVTARRDPDWQDNSIIRLSIEHTGDAVDRVELERVFASLAEGAAPVSREHGGLGIGLALASGLVRAMGGRIWFEEGARRLCFSLPFQVACAKRADVPKLERLEGVRICVAQPAPREREAAAAMLRDAGAFVESAVDARDALRLLEEAVRSDLPFDFVLIDERDCREVGRWRLPTRAGADDPMVVTMNHPNRRRAHLPLPPEASARVQRPAEPSALVGTFVRLLGTRPARRPKGVATPLRILAVDDSEDNRQLIATFLSGLPHSLEFAVDGADAVQRFRARNFDLVLMDIQMPIMNGLEATERIRRFEREFDRDRTPIVALTAFAFDEDRIRSLESGCDLHVTKPVSREKLLEIIDRCGAGALAHEVDPMQEFAAT